MYNSPLSSDAEAADSLIQATQHPGKHQFGGYGPFLEMGQKLIDPNNPNRLTDPVQIARVEEEVKRLHNIVGKEYRGSLSATPESTSEELPSQ